MSMSVCLSVCEHISGTARPIFAIFCACCLWPWLGLPLAALRYTVCTSGFVDDVMFARNGPRPTWRYADIAAASDVIASSCAG